MTNDTRRRWGVSVTPRPLFTSGKDPVPFVQEAGWAPGPVWTDAENLASTGIRSPDRPALSKSLYRLRYPSHNTQYSAILLFTASEDVLDWKWRCWLRYGKQCRCWRMCKYWRHCPRKIVNQDMNPGTHTRSHVFMCVCVYIQGVSRL